MSLNLAEHPELIRAGWIASAQSRRAEKIAKLIESAPPLKPEQIERLRSLLNSNAAALLAPSTQGAA